ncbi:MAG: PAS domain S-box protein [bacterium]|nr:PAS domain S-box protein [bacterium]
MRILIVASNMADSQVLNRLLSELPDELHILEAATIEAARQLLSEDTFELILTDPDLPDSDGPDTVKALRGAAGETAIVVLTDNEGDDQVSEMWSSGAQDCLSKGRLSAGKLEAALRRAHERRKMITDMEREVEARTLAESKLLTREHHLEEAQTVARVGSWEWTPDTGVFKVSREMRKIYGISGDERLGRVEEIMKRYLHPDDIRSVDDFIHGQGGAAAGSMRDIEFRIIKPDGTLRWLRAASPMVKVADDEEAHATLVGTVQDITESKEVECELLRTTAELEAIFNSAIDAYYMVDENRRIVRANDKLLKMLNMTMADVRGKICHELLPWCTEASCCHVMDWRSGDNPEEMDVEIESDDETKSLVVTPQAIMDSKMRLLSYFISVKDISRRKKKERELSQSQKLESIGQLAAGIAHEINTPIQYVGDNTNFLQSAFGLMDQRIKNFREMAIRGIEGTLTPTECAEALRSLEDSKFGFIIDQAPEAIEQTLEGVHRVANIVSAMKEFSHPSGGKREPADLHHAIDNTILVAKNEWKYVAEIVRQYRGDMPAIPVLLDEFNQVILNLVINAAHAIGDSRETSEEIEGRITIRTSLTEEHGVIELSDNGCGIPKQYLEKIFDPFFTTKEASKGTGQGLAIARSVIVEKHEGELLVESEIGKGTAFTIKLPLRVMTGMEIDLNASEAECEDVVC